MIGFLYVLTALLVELSFITFTGAMLGITTPIFSISGLIVAPLFSIGPSLLLFTGITTIFPNSRRGRSCLITGMVLLASVAIWTVPRIGWRNAVSLVLEPEAISLPIAYLILLLLKRRWVSVLIGSGLSSPFCVAGSAYLLYHHIFEVGPFAASELSLLVPGAFVTASFISAICFRIP